MDFFSTSSNVLNTVNTGEAPQLSSTYAEYDDGANVFLNYYSGASDSGWVISGTAGQTTSAPSGSPFGTDALYALNSGGNYLYTVASGQSTNMIIEYYTYINRLNDVFFLENPSGAGQFARQGDSGGWYGIAAGMHLDLSIKDIGFADLDAHITHRNKFVYGGLKTSNGKNIISNGNGLGLKFKKSIF
jgi:hypothetical protein